MFSAIKIKNSGTIIGKKKAKIAYLKAFPGILGFSQ